MYVHMSTGGRVGDTTSATPSCCRKLVLLLSHMGFFFSWRSSDGSCPSFVLSCGAAVKESLGLGKGNYESLTQQQQDELAERFYRYSNPGANGCVV